MEVPQGACVCPLWRCLLFQVAALGMQSREIFIKYWRGQGEIYLREAQVALDAVIKEPLYSFLPGRASSWHRAAMPS